MNEVFIVLLGVFAGAGIEWFRESRQSSRADSQEMERWARDNQREVIWRAQETLISAQQYVASPYDVSYYRSEIFAGMTPSSRFSDARGNALVAALEAYVQRLNDHLLVDLLNGYITYLREFVRASRLSESDWGSMLNLANEFHRRVSVILQGGDV